MKKQFPHDGIDRLVKRVLAGEVVFFVGAGFSVDSEGNTTWRLMERLLARFLAMTHYLANEELQLRDDVIATPDDNIRQDIKRRATGLLRGLQRTFDLQGRTSDPSSFMDGANVDRLANEYYEFNDWICSAFALLLDHIAFLQFDQETLEAIHEMENSFLESSDTNPVPIEEMDLALLLEMERPEDRGKALFLDTLGFDNSGIMGGNPMAKQFEVAVTSYENRLLKRHHVLARLAREGLCPVLLTTNYDLLLEGAFRFSGMRPSEPSDESGRRLPPLNQIANRPAAVSSTQFSADSNELETPNYRRQPPLHLVPTNMPYFSRIASASQFFSYGYGHAAGLIIKLHGCVENYRRAKKLRDVRAWQAYLPSIVFTFREIQTWREDAWSRDFMRTLLRTHTIVFCSYSGADPIMHNTFREVYDEMTVDADRHLLSDDGNAVGKNKRQEQEAPAFFLDKVGSESYLNLDILHAASKTVGANIEDLATHPNYLGFHIKGATIDNLAGQLNYLGFHIDKELRQQLEELDLHIAQEPFPQLDELMTWLYHRVYRKRQQEVLQMELRGVASLLLGHPCPPADMHKILHNFDKLRQVETRASENWDKEIKALENGREETTTTESLDEVTEAIETLLAKTTMIRKQFRRITGWTDHWHTGLMREIAMAQSVLHNKGPGLELSALRARDWYQPIQDDLAWAAWLVVVELALRRMVATWRGESRDWDQDCRWIRPSDCSQPTIMFSKGEQEPTPVSLTIMLKSFERTAYTSEAKGAFKRQAYWRLNPEGMPWRRASTQGRENENDDPVGAAGSRSPQRDMWHSEYGVTPPADVIWRWASETENRRDREQLALYLGVQGVDHA